MKITKYLALAASVAAMSACTDLDTVPEGGTITEGQKEEVVENEPSRVEAGVNAVFAQFSQYAPNYDALGSTRHNDFGYPGIMLRMDVNGFDLVGSTNGYNWFGNELTYADRSYTSNETIIIWNTLYQQIFVANNVAASVDPETEDSDLQFYLAQSLGARAFSYWVLAQLFQFTYAGHQNDLCVPLITDKNAETVAVEGAPRATVAQVYEQILDDIDSAVELLEKSTHKPADKRYISKAVAYGLRARIHLTMQQWSEAEADADRAIAAFSGRPYSIDELADPTLATSFWNSADAPIMWAVIVEVTDDVVLSGLINWPSHLHSLCYGYNSYSGGFQINKRLYKAIPATDVRKGWWTDKEGYSSHLEGNDKAQAYMTKYGPYTNVKFGPYQGVVGTSDNANDVPLMRIEEMYLIKAEAQAMSGNTAGGKTTLETLIGTYRDPEYTCTASSATAIQEEIFQQRRIEFWGEGLVWFDILRLEKTVDRRGAGYPDAGVVFNIPAGSDVLLYRVPRAEIQTNLQISEGDNNPIDDPTNYVVPDEN